MADKPITAIGGAITEANDDATPTELLMAWIFWELGKRSVHHDGFKMRPIQSYLQPWSYIQGFGRDRLNKLHNLLLEFFAVEELSKMGRLGETMMQDRITDIIRVIKIPTWGDVDVDRG
jgi:hypothetical protein